MVLIRREYDSAVFSASRSAGPMTNHEYNNACELSQDLVAATNLLELEHTTVQIQRNEVIVAVVFLCE